MIDNPYQVLGIDRSATQEEIKKAYRKKAKEYHPDLHPDDPNAARKMNEVNEAYDMLQNPEKYASRQARQNSGASSAGQTYGGQRSYGSYYSNSGQQSQNAYGWNSDFGFDFDDFFGAFYGGARQSADTNPQVQAGDSNEIRTVVNAIRAGQYSDAMRILTYIPSAYRNARWYYLCSLANHGMGNSSQAIDMMQRASQMEPNNSSYHLLLQQFRREEQAAAQRSTEYVVRRGPFGFLGRAILYIILFRFFMWFLRLFFMGF